MDETLREIASCDANCVAISQQISDDLPLGGHPQGLYMATAIEWELGRDRLVETTGNPFAFFRAYQDAATTSRDQYYLFSDEAAAYLAGLEPRLTRARATPGAGRVQDLFWHRP